ncbi:hypothetical protein DY000_02002575 [Brassica cretica]|uniref:Uncharacterized protein n=1 Tax=Brassica cretica TaxID=69181 RepID=A0ABQ7CHS4_BRACR|nr:hypothetical protein DY000_02002575 [Brassica cretica]
MERRQRTGDEFPVFIIIFFESPVSFFVFFSHNFGIAGRFAGGYYWCVGGSEQISSSVGMDDCRR